MCRRHNECGRDANVKRGRTQTVHCECTFKENKNKIHPKRTARKRQHHYFRTTTNTGATTLPHNVKTPRLNCTLGDDHDTSRLVARLTNQPTQKLTSQAKSTRTHMQRYQSHAVTPSSRRRSSPSPIVVVINALSIVVNTVGLRHCETDNTAPTTSERVDTLLRSSTRSPRQLRPSLPHMPTQSLTTHHHPLTH